jgi:hypothetical protein
MPPPKEPMAKVRYFWRKDPAYKVLMIALSVVLAAGLVFVSLISNALMRNPKLFTADATISQSLPTVVVPIGTVDLRPTFPPPGGGKGTGSSSQPPAQGTPALQPTSTDQTGQGGQLTLDITSIPNRVLNNSIVDVSVNASQPDISVSLVVLYSTLPYRATAGPAITDGNGDAILSWSVSVVAFGRHTQAMVYAVASDQNGQQVQSQPVTVQITSGG